ncbi:MAG TPA: hypothetical protein VGP47_08175 [Parachlamydiaceae bacterium]|nr:hypothetical protein [Parachlamydiaceae bacterium]
MSIPEFTCRVQNLIEAWHIAPVKRANKAFGLADRIKLYEETEKAVTELKGLYGNAENNVNAIANLSKLILASLEKHSHWEFDILAKWIASNSSHAEGPGSSEFVGAYRSLHHLFTIVDKMKTFSTSQTMDIVENGQQLIYQTALEHIDECPNVGPEYGYDTSITYLANLDKGSLFYINQMKNEAPFLIDDIKRLINSYIPTQDLIALKSAEKCNRALILPELIGRLNDGTIGVYDLGLSSIKQQIDFFGEECKKIGNLFISSTRSTDWNIIDWDEIATRFVNLKYLGIKGNNPTILKLEKELTSVKFVELFDISDPYALDHILKKCPSITKLRCLTPHYFNSYNAPLNSINNLGALKNSPFLTDIELVGNFKYVTDLDTCTSLEKLSFINCESLNNINLLQNCSKLSHLSIFQSKISKIQCNLASLKYFYVDNNYRFNEFSFLKGSPNLETLVIKGISLGNNANVLDHGLTITTLELIDFTNLIIPEIKKCASLKTLVLASNFDDAPIDLSEFNDCSSLETLSINKCKISNLSALAVHPTLKNLYLKKCDGMTEIDLAMLERKGIKVFKEKTKKVPRYILWD